MTSASQRRPNDDADEPAEPIPHVVRSRTARVMWAAVGSVCLGLGLVGVIVPGLPTTGFMILAAAAFSRSIPRLERWILSLPKVGPAVADFRAGLGMPLRAKVTAIAMMTVAIAVSCLLLSGWTIRLILIAAGVVGAVVILRVPTRRDDRLDDADADDDGVNPPAGPRSTASPRRPR